MVRIDRRDRISVGIIVLYMAVFLYPLLLGGRPVSGDHGAHFFKAWNLENNLLPYGRLYGWTHAWMAGYPENYHYPFGADLMVVIIHKLGFGFMSLDYAYALAVWLAHVIMGLGVYVFARTLFDYRVALLAAFLMITDQGGHPYGGWSGSLDLGVWPCPFSVGVALIALTFLIKTIEQPDWRNTGWLGLLIGLSLLIHPFQLINLAFTGTILGGCYLLCQPERVTPRAVLYVGAGAVLGGVIASSLLIPMASTSAWAYELSEAWDNFRPAWYSVLTGSFVPETLAIVPAFALAGSALLLARNSPRLFFCGLIVPMFILFAASDIGRLALHIIAPDFTRHLEFTRIIMLMKPFLFITAAYAIVELFRYAWPKRTDDAHPRLRKARISIALLLLAVFGGTTMLTLGKAFSRPTWPYVIYEDGSRPGIDQFVAWANKRAEQDPRFWRIAQDLDPNPNHGWLSLSTRLASPFFNIKWTPSIMFRYLPRGYNTKQMEQLNVRYVLTRNNWKDDADFTKIHSFRTLNLYEFNHWNVSPVTADGGNGAITVKQWDNERIEVDSDNAGPGALVLHMAFFPRWKARLDGRLLEPHPKAVSETLDFYTVPLAKGHYIFTFEPTPFERWALFVMVTGMLACAGLILLGRKGTPHAPG